MVAGDVQSAPAGTELPAPLVVKATDQDDRRLALAVVNFVITKGNGSVYAPAVNTNLQGIAQNRWTMGTIAGPQAVEVRSVDPTTGEAKLWATFYATSVPGAPATVNVLPAFREVAIGKTLQLTATAADKYDNSIPDASFTYSSGNTAIATVSEAGLVTGVALGATTISVTSGQASRTVPIVVTGGHPEEMIVSVTEKLPTSVWGIAISPAGAIYVTQPSVGRLGRADLPATAFTRSVDVGGGPWSNPTDVTFDPAGTTAYVANQGTGNVSVVDVATNIEVARIPVTNPGVPFTVIVSADGARVYVGTNVGRVVVIDAATRAVTQVIEVGGAINTLLLHPSRPLLYANSFTAGFVAEINTATLGVGRTFLTGGRPQGLAIAHDGSELYVANEWGPLQIWDLASGTRTTTISAATDGFGLTLTPDGTQLYMTTPFGGTVRIIDRVSRQVLRTLTALGEPRRIAFDARGTLAAITTGYTASVVFVR
jgi:YVTN family beta-propeller protein